MVGLDKTKEQLVLWKESLAGALSGSTTRFLCQPFDVLKTRFQLQVEPITKSSSTSKYSAVVQAIGRIASEEGVQGLWKGHVSGQLLSITYGLTQTFALATKISVDHFSLDGRSTHVHAICGACAGSVATIVSFPFDLLRTRFIAQGNEKLYISLFGGFVSMVEKEGLLSIFKGLTPTLILTTPQAGLMFGFYNLLKLLLKETSLIRDNELTSTGSLLAGCVAGIGAKTIVYPLDLTRKRIQLQGFKGRIGFGENFKCHGMFNCLYLTATREGFPALFKGLSPSIVKAGFTTALHFATYEEARKFLQNKKRI